MRSVLDPLGWPVATDVVPGQRADDPLYIPAIARVRESVGRCGLLYVAIARWPRWRPGRYPGWWRCYLCPLAATQLPPAELAGLRGSGSTGTSRDRITRLTATGTRQHLADGDERLERLSAEVAGTGSPGLHGGWWCARASWSGPGRQRCAPDWPRRERR